MIQLFRNAFLTLSIAFFLTACGGGGGGSTAAGQVDNPGQSGGPQGSQTMSFEADIEPILQAKCIGCHNSGDNPLAPLSLEGIERVNSFKSGIHFAVESGTMPPAGVQVLTGSERAKILAWLTDTPFTFVPEILHISLVEALAWDLQPKNRDNFFDHRPEEVDCPRGTGFLVEEDALEVRTEFCNYLALTQQSLLDLGVGTELELALSHSDLNFNAPSSAHVAVSIGGTAIWESNIEIPSDSNILKQTLVLPFAVNRGDPIDVHLHNHGANAWTVHSLEALISSDEELSYCPTFESTFEAIQTVVFEQAGCANSLCHGEAKEGGLDLTPENAYDSILGVTAQGSSLLLVDPRQPSTSYFYHKLSAKTFPGSYPIDGAPMPSAGTAISPGQLEAIRLWIEAGAPREGSVGDTLGRGEDEIENLLGVCLPEAEPLNTIPLPPPDADKGIQFTMPSHDVPAEKETEICFAVYEDFRNVIPPEFLDETGDYFYARADTIREDAFTHHNVFYEAPVGVEAVHDPAFGEWTCAGGEQPGESCEPTDLDSCGVGKCRSEIQKSVACRGYGPPGPGGGSSVRGISVGVVKEGFFKKFPSHGLYYWNSHAFNLTTKDGEHHVWRNAYFADDRRFEAFQITETRALTAAAGTPPFEKRTVCKDFVFKQGDGVLSITSHTHKRGERFFMSMKNGEQIYETFTYDEPLFLIFEPAMVLNSAEPDDRTIEYCATYNNGVNEDGSPNIETATRASRRPLNGRACNPIACVRGNIGGVCSGVDDDAACDSSPGAGDGWCDACAITPGVSSDDEMFIFIADKLSDYDKVISANPAPAP